MTLYWPKQQVALQIVGCPHEDPFEAAEEGWTVFRVTERQMQDYDYFKEVMATVNKARAQAAMAMA